MADIELYENSADQYEELQERRPDYSGAKKVFLELVERYFKNKSNISIADFCCGTGNNTYLVSEHISIAKATLIDINKRFLELAVLSRRTDFPITTIQSDILKAHLKSEFDLVISMFAYHHVPDSEKNKYIKIAKGTLKKGGILMLGEIYTPNKETTLAYYKKLLDSIPVNQKTSDLETFLMQTAASDSFEYKVSREYAHRQLKGAGFTLLDAIKIWPQDKTFSDGVGTFVEVWQF